VRPAHRDRRRRNQAECHDGILALYLPRAEHDKRALLPSIERGGIHVGFQVTRGPAEEGTGHQGRDDRARPLLRAHHRYRGDADALFLTMEMPGVDRRDVDIKIEGDALRVEGRIDATKYDGFEPLYTE